MRRKRELSRLELAVLGLISKGGPCTAYWIRLQFRQSPSTFFSGSAGAVYPAVSRLEERSLISATLVQEGRRTSHEYDLTEVGKQALTAWLLPPLPTEDIAFTMDPIRTRVYSLDLLPLEDQMRFIEDALTRFKRREAVVRSESEEMRDSGDLCSYLGGLGVVHEVRSRITWLKEVRAALRNLEDGTRETLESLPDRP